MNNVTKIGIMLLVSMFNNDAATAACFLGDRINLERVDDRCRGIRQTAWNKSLVQFKNLFSQRNIS
jgi:hypothetical protein